MSKENLQTKTCKELRELAKEKGIVGRWDMTKSQLINAILETEEVSIPKENTKSSGVKSVKDEDKVDNHENDNTDAEAKQKESAGVEVNMEDKMKYIENAAIGTIVAFRISGGKVKSAKITKKSTKNRKLKLETSYGAEYIVNYDNVIWVRTGKRWPKGIYKLLKGLMDKHGECEKQNGDGN